MQEIRLKTSKRIELIDITNKIEKIIASNEIKKGVCLIYCPHTTTGLTINENTDSSVKEDLLNFLNNLVPVNKNYKHLEGNSDAHIKSSLLGNSLRLIISKGKLVLGEWQGILFGEFDGPRNRKVFVKVVKD